eukprot:GFYU01011470.1.p1 GENE.GFYU01011470.1~~GFYU01011470.1.p1  ORF type:complete len:315 (-),score=70.64 GFYU01011470.1:40-984(-)
MLSKMESTPLLLCALLFLVVGTAWTDGAPHKPTPKWPPAFQAQVIYSYETKEKGPVQELQNVYYDYMEPRMRERIETVKIKDTDVRVISINRYDGGSSYLIHPDNKTCLVTKAPPVGNYPPNWLASAQFNGTARVKSLNNMWLTDRGSVYYEGIINRTPVRIEGQNYALDFLDFKPKKTDDAMFNPCTGNPRLYCVDVKGKVKLVCPHGGGRKFKKKPPTMTPEPVKLEDYYDKIRDFEDSAFSVGKTPPPPPKPVSPFIHSNWTAWTGTFPPEEPPPVQDPDAEPDVDPPCPCPGENCESQSPDCCNTEVTSD